MADVMKVWGPPGTGKTTRLMQLLTQELERGVPSERIAFLCHTNAAADVVAERAGEGVDKRWFRTIHSACVRRLGIPRESIVDAVDYAEFSRKTGMRIISERADGLLEDGAFYIANNYGPVLRAYDLARLTGRTLEDVVANMPPHSTLVSARRVHFIRAWEAYKSAHGLFDFTDMLLKYEASDVGPLPCDVVFLDEAQDLSQAQWNVFEKMTLDAKRVYLAGDDDQAIYGFMGGSEWGFLDHACHREEVLSHSYRVPKLIGERATRVIQRVQRRKEKAVEWQSGTGDIHRLNLSASNLPWRAWAAQKKSVLVLARHRKDARAFSHDLTGVGVPHALGAFSLHNCAEAKIVRDFALARRGSPLPWRRMAKLLSEGGEQGEAERVRAAGASDRTLVVEPTKVRFPWDADEWPRLFARSREKLLRIRAVEVLIRQQGLEVIGSDPHVAVMTMHASKGREADITVLITDCNETVRKNLNAPTEIRLAYVALTRAKEKCLILSPRTDKHITHLTRA